MRRLKYILPLLLILLLGAALPGPAGAEDAGWSLEDGSARGVTLTAQGDRLQVSLALPEEEYTVWLVSPEQDFDDPVYMGQHAGTASFPIVLTGKLEEIKNRDLTLWVYGAGTAIGLHVRYDAPETTQTPSPAPSPPTTPRPPRYEDPDDGGYTAPAGTPKPPASPRPAETPVPAETPAPDSAVPQFTDTAGHWGEAYIAGAAARGLFSGYGDGRFAPDDPMTRAQFVTVLWRIAGRPDAAAVKTPFTDVGGESAEFQSAIAWGHGKGYIDGVSDDRFAPSDPLTREQAMKILFYFAGGEPGGETELYDVYDRGYTDSAAISSWARAPMYWGVYNRIIAGVGDGLLAPQNTATRAQLAKILIVYLDGAA